MNDSKETVHSIQNRVGTHEITETVAAHRRPAQVQARWVLNTVRKYQKLAFTLNQEAIRNGYLLAKETVSLSTGISMCVFIIFWDESLA